MYGKRSAGMHCQITQQKLRGPKGVNVSEAPNGISEYAAGEGIRSTSAILTHAWWHVEVSKFGYSQK